MDTASKWDSYKPTMLNILDHLKPKRALEFGVGKSTETILEAESVKTLDTIEHNASWFSQYKHLVSDRFNLIYEPNGVFYPLVSGRYAKYDFIFIDGILREKCLMTVVSVLSDKGVVLLHDAKRPQYQEAIQTYKNIFWEDDGHTVALSNNENVMGKLIHAHSYTPV